MTKRLKKGFSLVELMIVVAIIGILSAIAIPNFIRFQARSKQAEVKTNMKAIFTGQKARFADKDRYSMALGDIGFAPERGNRYRYDLGNAAGTAEAASGGITATCMVLEDRMAAVATVTGATPACGVEEDVFRYTTSITPTALTSRGAVTWALNSNGATDLAADGVGVNLTLCPMCDFAATAVGNVDNDSSGDEWFVSSQNGSVMSAMCADATPTGQTEHPGTPINTYNDVNCDEM